MTTPTAVRVDSPSYQAYQILHIAFTVAPIVAGLDKFFRFLVDWDQYLSPIVPRMLGVSGHTFMLGVGVIEVIAGLLVAILSPPSVCPSFLRSIQPWRSIRRSSRRARERLASGRMTRRSWSSSAAGSRSWVRPPPRQSRMAHQEYALRS